MEIKCQLDATEVFITDLIACSTCFGHLYAHHQELKIIIQWLLPVVFRSVVFKLLVWCEAEGYVPILQTGHITLISTPDQLLDKHSTKYHTQQPLYNTLELLMMGIVVPETCWAISKICNKNLCCIKLAFYFHISKEQNSSWETNRFLGQSRNFPNFMEPGASLLYSQQPATCPYPEPVQSSHACHWPGITEITVKVSVSAAATSGFQDQFFTAKPSCLDINFKIS